jgi:hypothetical protein
MQIPTYFFQSLESIYYFRMRVPTDLQPATSVTPGCVASTRCKGHPGRDKLTPKFPDLPAFTSGRAVFFALRERHQAFRLRDSRNFIPK